MPTDLSVLNETLINRRLNEEVLHYNDSSRLIELVLNFLSPEDLARVSATRVALINGAGNVALRRSGRVMDDECKICLEPVTEFSETFIHPSCGSRFHRKCWVDNLKHGNPCPTCRGADTCKSFSALAPYFVWENRENLRKADITARIPAVVDILVYSDEQAELQSAWDEFKLLTHFKPVVLVKHVRALWPLRSSRIAPCRYVLLHTLSKLYPEVLMTYANDVVRMFKDDCNVVRAMALETIGCLDLGAVTLYVNEIVDMLQDKCLLVLHFALQTLRAIDPDVLAQRRYAGAVVRIMKKTECMRCTWLALYALSTLKSVKLKEYVGDVIVFLAKKYDNKVRYAALQTMGCLDADVLEKYVGPVILIIKDETETIDVRFGAFKAIRDFKPEQYVTSRVLRAFKKLLLRRPYDSLSYYCYHNQRVHRVNW